MTVSWDSFGTERECPICGKQFLSHGEDWGYKRSEIYLCSWSCLRKWDLNHGDRYGMQAVICRMIIDGKSNADIVAATGASKGRIGYWRNKLRVENREEDDDEGTLWLHGECQETDV